MTLPRMDSRTGLDYIVENREYVSKLGAALDTNNTTVKKQVFELLSALCAYNSEGYSRAIETLEFYKNLKNERYRFKIVINELEKTTNIEYQVALLAFINCVIISAANLQDRVRIRNEFIGLKVLPLLNDLRKVAQSVGDIIVQLDVFDEQRECDEAQSLQGPNGINLNSHLDVFSAILGQVADTPQEIPFLSILQHLLRIEPKEAVSDIIWDTTEKLVHRATLLENHEDSVRLLRSPSVQKFTCPHCRGEATSPSRKQSSAPLTPSSFQVTPPTATNSLSSSSPLSPTSGRGGAGGGPPAAAPPPPPPPPIPAFGNGGSSGGIRTGGGVPPPPPPPGCNRIPGPPIAPPPPAPNLLSNNCTDGGGFRPTTPDMGGFNENSVLLPQQEIPAPKAKMKTINWNKIPQNKVIGKQNIWATVSCNRKLDWTQLEGLFCLQSTSAQGSPKLGRDSGTDTLDRKSKKENTEITLLDGKRSLNVNIFLKQFRTSNEDIIELIRNGEHSDIGAEKLRGLLKILPEFDELDMLKSFNGDRSRLGNAEKFLMQLLEVPNYKLRIESMLLKEEFAANVSYLDPYINAMIFAGDDLMNNKMLQEVLYMVVLAGNFLNSGGYAGNAAGVKLSSLQKLTDIRANKPGVNLMHFVAMEVEKQNPELLNFPDQLTMLENASKTTSDQINYEINALDTRIKKIKRQVELPATDLDIKEQMTDFLRTAEHEVAILQRGMKEVDSVRLKLAEYFCEDPASFKLEECFKIFQNLADKFKQAVKENERRQQQEEQATLRRKQREEQLARRARQLSQCGTPVSDSENPLLLDPSFDPRSSPAFSRRRMGSFNTGIDCNSWREDGISPDITPNGSLRRRRSRVLEEDDDLMKFLRASGQDNGSRERKASAYGSLDRSWARKARSGSASRKRPELLNIDFGADRERANSPSPMAETKPPPPPAPASDDNKPRISREWRQKIESWLQSNENDEKQNEEYKRKRRLVNNGRRSLENDTAESERNKLDPLPEEKISVNANGVETYKRDWKPSKTLEKTDIAGTIQAIEDVNNTRDKSSWRKSNLNVSNSSEEVITREDTNRSKTSSSNNEHEDRKSLIHILGELPASDRLQIYVRRPSDINDVESQKSKTPLPNGTDTKQQQLPPLILDVKSDPSIYKNHQSPTESPSAINRFITIRDRHDDKYSRKEIDSDNIETPPVVRRATQNSSLRRPHIYAPTVVTVNSTTECDGGSLSPGVDQLGDNEPIGHFDRFSAARRTRRYKRPTDYSSGTEDISQSMSEKSSKDTIKHQSIPNNESDSQIKKPIICEKTVAKLEKVGRHISSINQEDVREAIRNLKSPTGEPERIWSPPREIISNDKSAPTPTQATTVIKVSANSHELNDEGFEETQSLVSDTPSHGKESTSSCNDVNEAVTKQSTITTTTTTQRSQGRSASNKEPVTSPHSHGNTTSRDHTVSKSRMNNPQKNQIHNILERNKRSMDRARLLRASNAAPSTANTLSLPSATTAAMRRANSLRKSDSSSSNKKDVERSSSRTSLRSSRSSLNSGTSTNTVRRIPVKPLLTNSVESSPSKRPLSAANPSRNQRISASRSSSSGSSIGATIRKPTTTATTTAARTNNGNTTAATTTLGPRSSSTARNATTAAVLLKASVTNNNVSSSTPTLISRQRSPTRPASAPSSRLSGFMRPTASSATKRLQGDSRGK